VGKHAFYSLSSKPFSYRGDSGLFAGKSCGICGGQSGTGVGFSSSSSYFPCVYHLTAAPSVLMYYLGDSKGPVAAAVPKRLTLTPLQQH
jgi:hypothetical protein